MRVPAYGIKDEEVEELQNTIEAIFRYGRNVFKIKGVAKYDKKKNAYPFSSHIRHLVEAEYLSIYSTAKNRENRLSYYVNDWSDLNRYCNIIKMMLRPSKRNRKKLEKLTRI